MVIVAKMQDRMVQIVRYADTVAFSKERGWFCIVMDFEKPKRKQEQIKWIPANTRFEWVREFIDTH